MFFTIRLAASPVLVPVPIKVSSRRALTVARSLPSLLALGELELCFRQRLLVVAKETGVIDLLACAEGGKRSQANIDADRLYPHA
jgi:hypothetical protein